MVTHLIRQAPSGPILAIEVPDLPISSNDVTNESAVPGTTLTAALNNLTEGFVLLAPTPGANITTALQSALDALPEHGQLQIVSKGIFYIDKPIRLVDRVGLRGLPSLPGSPSPTCINKAPGFLGGPSLICGLIGNPATHGPAILDDANYSYAMGPATCLPLGLAGCFPQNFAELWLEMPFVVTDVPTETFFFIAMGSNGKVAPEGQPVLSARWATWDGNKLQVHVRIGGVDITLSSTSTYATLFNDGLRHMLAVGYDGTTVRLFIDGVIEDSEAASGTFTTEHYDVFFLGAGRTIYGRDTFYAGAAFDCGGFYLGSQNLENANYAVSWNTRAANPANGDYCQLVCNTANEEDDLIKLILDGNGYGWMKPIGVQGYAGGLLVSSLEFRPANNGRSDAIMVHTCHSSRFDDLYVNTETTLDMWQNCYECTVSRVRGFNGPRYNAYLDGALNKYSEIEFRGSRLGAFVTGSVDMDSVFVTDYTKQGAWLYCDGFIGAIGIGDESSSEVPTHTVLIGNVAVPTGLTIASLGITAAQGAATVPITIVKSIGAPIRFRATAFLHAATPCLIRFSDTNANAPIFAEASSSTGAPISDEPWKVLGGDGPAGGLTLADADATLTAAMARQFNFDEVPLTDDRAVTLDDEIYAQPVPDGTTYELIVNPYFMDKTVTLLDHTGAPLRVCSEPTIYKARYSSTAEAWSIVTAVGYLQEENPLTILGSLVALWLRADRGVTDASGVSLWEDQSGNGNDYAGATNKVTFQPTGGPSGKPALYGPPAASWAAAARLIGPDFSALTEAEIFLVAKKDTDPGTAAEGAGGLQRFGANDGNSTHTPFFADGQFYDGFGSTARKSTGVDPGDCADWFLLNTISTAAEWTQRFNRVQTFTTGTNTVGWNGSSSLFWDSAGSTDAWWQGHICEVIIATQKLTNDQRSAIEDYVQNFWGV